MKKITFLLVVMAAVLAFSSCNKSETYADQLERENNAINAFIVKKGINVISEGQFASQGNTTDVTKNQYVHFSNTGVYMQIVEKGTGEPVRKGETATVLCRFTEWNLIRDTLQLSNQFLVFGPKVDDAYKSTSVPGGWLVPMPYVRLGRLSSATSKLAHVKLIVPSQQGQINASQAVYPCFYDLTFQRGL